MTQNVQDLIDKIKKEGLEASQQKAKEIENEVQKKVDEMIEKAKAEAEKIVAEAKSEQEKIEQSTRASLHQAARDTVLSLKQTINDLLMKIVGQDVRDALGKEQLTALIVELSKEFIAQNKGAESVEIDLNEETKNLLEKDLLAKLQKEIKADVTIQTSNDLTGGFTVSFDEGKSCFDFSEETLAGYLSKNMNEYVAGLLKG